MRYRSIANIGNGDTPNKCQNIVLIRKIKHEILMESIFDES